MKKTVAFLLAIVLLLVPQAVFAHSKLVKANPAPDTTITEEVKEMRLEFNTKIEQGSTVAVKDETNKEIPVQVQVAGNELVATTSDVLPNGAIQVHWTIIGADGHTVEGEYQFTVNRPAVATPSEEQQLIEKTVPAPQVDPNETKQIEEKATILPWILGALLLALIIFLIILLKGKKRNK
ncbi:copper resistance CopC family protein [Risungbinella massiliensis]|uniref:copper resistance CopC family protein n=1 Tax=Risungbinella massiliensis TaxID=1329796 RepID=UPI00069C9D3F|nr:copper resistance CopC family protein [Risungbinella massiliensis]